MVDLSILALLSREQTIAGHQYRVAWNCEINQAQVLMDGEAIQTFPFEIDAHRYIQGLRALNQRDNNWRDIDEDNTD